RSGRPKRWPRGIRRERSSQLRRRKPATQQAQQHTLAGRLIFPVFEARTLEILHRMHFPIRKLLVNFLAERQPEDRKAALALPDILKAILNDVLGLRKVAPVFAILDRFDRGEDPIADRKAAQQPQLDRCRAWQRA